MEVDVPFEVVHKSVIVRLVSEIEICGKENGDFFPANDMVIADGEHEENTGNAGKNHLAKF